MYDQLTHLAFTLYYVFRHREGYAEGDYTLYHVLNASEFLKSEDFLEKLAASNEVQHLCKAACACIGVSEVILSMIITVKVAWSRH